MPRWLTWIVDHHRFALVLGLAVSIAAAVVATLLVEHRIFNSRINDLAVSAKADADLLHAITDQSPLMGAVTLLGLTAPEIKAVANGSVVDGPSPADMLLQEFSRLFEIDEAFVVNHEGRIAAYQAKSGHNGKGTDVKYRPYFKEAMLGISNVYLAVGSTTKKPGFYLAAPVRTSLSIASEVGGVIVVKVGMDQVNSLLARNKYRTLLLSPEGVVVASNYSDWIYRVMGPSSPERQLALQETKRYPKVFDATLPDSLPFSTSETYPKFNEHRHALISIQLNWNDPSGNWSLIVVDNTESWFPLFSKVIVFIVTATGWLFFLLWLHSIISRSVVAQRNAESLRIAHDKTKLALADLKEAKDNLDEAFAVIEGSIKYASSIQRSILPNIELVNSIFADHFILWEPRDTVGGDIYWCCPWGEGVLFALGDCTGHGVPGAFMTLIATSAFDRARSEVAPGKVGQLITRIHQLVQLALKQNSDHGESDDGMELGLCYITEGGAQMVFCGARFSLFSLIPGESAIEIKGDKRGIGYRRVPFDQQYNQISVDVRPNMRFYMSSDGLIDQVGSEVRRGFGKVRLMELLSRTATLSMEEQKAAAWQALLDHQGAETRRDDVAVAGFQLHSKQSMVFS